MAKYDAIYEGRLPSSVYVRQATPRGDKNQNVFKYLKIPCKVIKYFLTKLGIK